MKDTKRRPRALPALTALLSLAVLVPWLLCMGLLTAVTAQREGEAAVTYHGVRAEQLTAHSVQPWEGLGSGPIHTFPLDAVDGILPQPLIWNAQVSDAVFDTQGNCLGGSWEDFIFFEYLTQEEWDDGVKSSGRYARAILDRTFLTDGGQQDLKWDIFVSDTQALRLEGVLVDSHFTPHTISFWSKRTQAQSWTPLYENPNPTTHDAQPITLYATNFHTCYAPQSTPLTYRGTRYDSVAQLVQTLGPDLLESQSPLPLWSWPNLLVVSVASTHQGYLVSFAWCSPWLQAAAQLRWVYLLTLALCVLLLLRVRKKFCHELLAPIQQLSQALDTRQQWLLLRPSQVCRWQEGHRLQEQFQTHGAQWREQKDEIQRLNQALTYAKTAEEHRRTFTSHMAHELKTPLAVIHSYAQGLQEHIAEDKREKYLATICSEADRMNEMVLELLDLSRLEAGRVKLRRESFSLSQLTRSTLEKLSPALETRRLHLSTCLESPAPVLADRKRMAQVVENLLTNAIKYATAGGHIQVEVAATHTHTCLVISNDCPPIPPGELEQLFEPFYRRPDAATGEGTGLGLAIVRHIVHLHGGSCTVQATPTGVQFTVTL